jgi:HK97 family phage major capsid protein
MRLVQWLEKAAFTTADIDPAQTGTAGGILSNEQARQFLQIAIDEQVIARESRIETSNSPKFEVPRLSLNDRVLRVGVEATRVVEGDRVKPATGLMTLSTVLFKGEMQVSDELFEDNIERGGLADRLARMLAQAVGRDIEELAIKGDTSRTPGVGDANTAEMVYLDSLNGIIAQAQDSFAAAQKVDATTITAYDDLFATMIEALPSKFRRNYDQLRLYVPVAVADGYQKSLAQRGTGLGDQALVANLQARLAFRGVPIVSVPLMSGTSTVNGSPIDYSQFCLLCNPSNIVFGYHRRVRVERYRDPREGVTSFLPTLRFDVKYANPEGEAVLASNVDITV